jgi:hypothetical protein
MNLLPANLTTSDEGEDIVITGPCAQLSQIAVYLRECDAYGARDCHGERLTRSENARVSTPADSVGASVAAHRAGSNLTGVAKV